MRRAAFYMKKKVARASEENIRLLAEVARRNAACWHR